jgi:hypothetical protein
MMKTVIFSILIDLWIDLVKSIDSVKVVAYFGCMFHLVPFLMKRVFSFYFLCHCILVLLKWIWLYYWKLLLSIFVLPKDSQRSGESSSWHLPGPEFESQWEQISPWVKKNPRLSSFSKHRLRPGLVVVTVRGTDPALTWAAEAPV